MCNIKPVVNREEKIDVDYVEVGLDYPDSLVKPCYTQTFNFEVQYKDGCKSKYTFQTERTVADWKMKLVEDNGKNSVAFLEFTLYQFIILNMKIRALYASREDQKEYFGKVKNKFKFTLEEMAEPPCLKPFCMCYNSKGEMYEILIRHHPHVAKVMWVGKDALRAIYTIGNIFSTFGDREPDRLFNLKF